MTMLRLPRDGHTLRWIKLLAAVLLALWFAFGPRPSWAQDAMDDGPAIDSAVQIQELKDRLAADPYDAEGHTKLGILYAKEDLLEEARDSFIKALQAAPTEPSSHLNLGLILLRMELWDDAINTLNGYALMTNIEARGHVLLGEAYAGKGELDTARSIWVKATETPGMAAAEKAVLIERAATSYFDDEETAAALDVLEKDPRLLEGPAGATLREMAVYANLELAKSARDDGRVEDALRDYRRVRSLDPTNPTAYSEPAQLLIEEGRLQDADTLARQAEEHLPGSAVAEFLAGRVAEKRGDFQTAATRFRAASRLDPELPGVFASLGAALVKIGYEAGAQAALGEAVKRGEGGAAAAFNMGVVLSKDDKFQEAIPHLEAAVAADPTMKDAHRALGIAYRKTSKFEQAARTYQGIVEQFGPDPADLYQLAYAQAKSNRHADAVSNYEMVVALQPQNFFGHYNLGNSLMTLNRHQAAAESFQAALAQPAPSASAHERAQYNLALCYQKLELFEEAIAEYKKALELRETYRSLVNLAICYAAIEDEELSDQYYERAAELKKGR